MCVCVCARARARVCVRARACVCARVCACVCVFLTHGIMHNLYTYLFVNVISIRYNLYMVHKNLHSGIKTKTKYKIQQFINDRNFQSTELVYI